MASAPFCAQTCPGGVGKGRDVGEAPDTHGLRREDGFVILDQGRGVCLGLRQALDWGRTGPMLMQSGPDVRGKQCFDQWLEPSAIRIGCVRVPGLEGGFDAGRFHIGELEVLGRN